MSSQRSQEPIPGFEIRIENRTYLITETILAHTIAAFAGNTIRRSPVLQMRKITDLSSTSEARNVMNFDAIVDIGPDR
jgi:hypothetical protein